MDVKVVLGIDPGYARCGWGVIQANGDKINLVDFGTIQTDNGVTFSTRMREVREHLKTIITTHRPSLAGVEMLCPSAEKHNILNVAQVRGVILLLIDDAQINLHQLPPGEVKRQITGSWIAGKKDIEKAVRDLLNIDPNRREYDDAFDALAVAISAATFDKMRQDKLFI